MNPNICKKYCEKLKNKKPFLDCTSVYNNRKVVFSWRDGNLNNSYLCIFKPLEKIENEVYLKNISPSDSCPFYIEHMMSDMNEKEGD